MGLSQTDDGFLLLSKWKINSERIKASFKGMENKIYFACIGTIIEFDGMRLSFTGENFVLSLDLDEAATEKSSQKVGPQPSMYEESTEISLSTGDSVTFSSMHPATLTLQ